MIQLPTALAPWASYRQFILCKLVPSTEKPGKMEKLPIDWRDCRITSAHDRSIWISSDEALRLATQYGPGFLPCFVFTEDDPFWFLDVDSCRDASGQWSQLAAYFCQEFAGAAIEVSTSGRGLHLFGSGALACPAHSTRVPKELAAVYPGLEFYTSGRFVALTGDMLGSGTVAADYAFKLPSLVTMMFPPRQELAPQDWTTEPVPQWRGPTDDEDLIRRAMGSRTARNAFGGTASFADLWEANAEVLGKLWPDESRPFDPTRADAALAQLLAFWTGKNCERIERLMRRSALAREKWDSHATYLRELTICGCVARQNDVLQDKAPEPSPFGLPVSPGESAAIVPTNPPDTVLPLPAVAASAGHSGPGMQLEAPTMRRVSGSVFLDADAQMQLFAGCTYIVALDKALVPGGKLLSGARFKAAFGGRSFVMAADNGKVERNAWEAFTQSQMLRPPIADTVCFRPDLAPGAIVTEGGVRAANTWWPVQTPRKQGDATPFLQHLATLIPDEIDRAHLLYYLAAMVQFPGVKFKWAPLIVGVEGNGKTIISQCVQRALGQRYVHWPLADKLGKQFNAWLYGKLAYLVEDIYTEDGNGEYLLEKLKPMITSTEGYEIEFKGVDQESMRICGNFVFNSNHMGGLPKTANDRRLGIFHCAQQQKADKARDGLTRPYFRTLFAWLEADGYAIVHDYLASLEIPENFNPAFGGEAPTTTSTAAAIALNEPPCVADVREAIEQGVAGFRGGWISSMALERWLSRPGGRAGGYVKRLEALDWLGYVKHPALSDGRTGSEVQPDMGKPRLFVKKDSPASKIGRGAEVEKAYSRAQGVVFQEK